jgi:hypothetical protein
MNEFESELEQLEWLGIKPKTADWEPRSIYYCMVRGYTTARMGALVSQIKP